jgi:dihydroorotase
MELDLPTALSRVTSDAARLVGITRAGHLAPGARADICIFDPAARRTVTRDCLRSQGKNTPFLGHELPGAVRYTMVEGQVMFEG